MTTPAAPANATKGSWWQKLAESGTDKKNNQKVVTYALSVAVVVAIGILGWNFFKGSQSKAKDDVAEKLLKGRELLPPGSPRELYSGIQEARFHYLQKSFENYRMSQRSNLLTDPKANSEYVTKVENAIADLTEAEADIAASEQAAIYWNTLQQLHFFAALNTTETAKRNQHLEKQAKILETLGRDHKNHVLVSIEPDAEKPGVKLVDYWLMINKEERAFSDKLPQPLTMDEGMEATMTLSNDKVVKFKFYSRVAPKSTAVFKMQADSGFFNETALFKVDGTAKTLTFGSPFSKLAPDRPRIWHKGDAGFTIPREATSVLPPKKGRIYWERSGAGSHGAHFVVHLGEDLSQNYADSVFAEVTEGIEVLDDLLKLEVINDEAAENKLLPKEPIKIKSLVVSGEQKHLSDDSWKPMVKIPEVPAQSEEEKRLEAEAAAASQPTSAPSESEGNK